MSPRTQPDIITAIISQTGDSEGRFLLIGRYLLVEFSSSWDTVLLGFDAECHSG